VVLAVAAFVLGRTTYGRRIYATGANPAASRLSGVRTGAITASAYLICALLALLAGLMTSGYSGYVDNYLSHNLNLDSIAAAVVGGTALTGGRGGVGRTTIGVVLIAVVINFMGLLGLGNAGQLLVEGAVILGAVWLQGRGRSAATS
jgi:ribose transport system permease protein